MNSPRAVYGNDLEMVRGVRSQTKHIRADVLVRVAALALVRGVLPVGVGCAPLEMNSRIHSVRINRAVECC